MGSGPSTGSKYKRKKNRLGNEQNFTSSDQYAAYAASIYAERFQIGFNGLLFMNLLVTLYVVHKFTLIPKMVPGSIRSTEKQTPCYVVSLCNKVLTPEGNLNNLSGLSLAEKIS